VECALLDESYPLPRLKSRPDSRPRLLDLFCGAGGAGTGYHRAGFEVVGVDLAAQPSYPFIFAQADALRLLHDLACGEPVPFGDRGIAAIHASPPCQASTRMRTRWRDREYDDLIAPVRELLIATGLPYVIENVEGAALREPVRVCGSAFALGADGAQLRRHRLFESNVALIGTACAHRTPTIGVYGHPGGSSRRDAAPRHSLAQWREAMGIDWPCSTRELTEAIPPAYTHFIGRQLLAHIEATA
jgi:DNA (cytosine-5)-methyltransferase 1